MVSLASLEFSNSIQLGTLCKKGLIDCNRSDNRFVALTKRETRVGISSLSRFADHAILISCFALIGKNLLFLISSDVMEFQGHFLRFLRKSKNDVISRKVRCLSLQLHFYLRWPAFLTWQDTSVSKLSSLLKIKTKRQLPKKRRSPSLQICMINNYAAVFKLRIQII